MATKKAKRASAKRAKAKKTTSLEGLELVMTIPLHGVGYHLAASPRAPLIAVATENDYRLYNTTDWEEVGRRHIDGTGSSNYGELAFSPAADSLAVTIRSTLTVISTPDLTELWHAGVDGELGRPAWSPNGQWVATGAENRPRVFEAIAAPCTGSSILPILY